MLTTASVPTRPTREEIDLSTLLAAEGRDFIACAYRAVLGREPDAEGLEYYVVRLRNGATKRELIAQLYLSPEVAAKGRSHPKLARLSLPYRLKRIPLIGLLVTLVLYLQRCIASVREMRGAAANVHLLREDLHARAESINHRLTLIQEQLRSAQPPTAPATAPPLARTHAAQQHTGTGSALTLEDLLSIARHLHHQSKHQ